MCVHVFKAVFFHTSPVFTFPEEPSIFPVFPVFTASVSLRLSLYEYEGCFRLKAGSILVFETDFCGKKLTSQLRSVSWI